MATDADALVSEWFEDISRRCANAASTSVLSHGERIVYYVVASRCEADMNGFCSVFEQLLDNREDLDFFVGALRYLEEDELAQAFSEVGRLLTEAGYFADPTREFHALPADVLEEFGRLQARIEAGDPLWTLDEKLATLRKTGSP